MILTENQSKKIEDLMKEMKLNTQRIIDNYETKTNELKEQHAQDTQMLNNNINGLRDTIQRISDKLQENGANVPDNEKLKEKIVIMSKDNNSISIIRGQNRYIAKSIKIKQSNGYEVMEKIDGIASTVGTFNVVKDQLISENLLRNPNIKRYNDFELVGITISDLIHIIKSINESCKMIQ